MCQVLTFVFTKYNDQLLNGNFIPLFRAKAAPNHQRHLLAR